jgi:hypothetical protein
MRTNATTPRAFCAGWGSVKRMGSRCPECPTTGLEPVLINNRVAVPADPDGDAERYVAIVSAKSAIEFSGTDVARADKIGIAQCQNEVNNYVWCASILALASTGPAPKEAGLPQSGLPQSQFHNLVPTMDGHPTTQCFSSWKTWPCRFSLRSPSRTRGFAMRNGMDSPPRGDVTAN